jgi:hypothetical protein
MPFTCSEVTCGLAIVLLKISFSRGRTQPGGFLKQGSIHHLAANAQLPMRYCIGQNIKLQLWLSNEFDRIRSSCVHPAHPALKYLIRFWSSFTISVDNEYKCFRPWKSDALALVGRKARGNNVPLATPTRFGS